MTTTTKKKAKINPDLVISYRDGTGQLKQSSLSKLRKECFIQPVVLPEGRVTILQDEFHYVGRIAIPDTAKRKPTTGHVLLVSNYETLGDLVGLRVVYGIYSGTLLKFKGRDAFRVLECREILGIVNHEDAELENID